MSNANAEFATAPSPRRSTLGCLLIERSHLRQLIEIESQIHYREPPPAGSEPFVVVRRRSPVLLSAPHGAITHRGCRRQEWHDEDDYTAGIVFLLAELCQTAAIATVWRTDDSDPNYHSLPRSPYKRALRELIQEAGVQWVIDLHGAANSSLAPHHLVDLGTRKEKQSLPADRLARLAGLIQNHLGPDTVSYNRFCAYRDGRTITAYSHGRLGLHAVQIELKSAVRVPLRRTDATAFAQYGPFAARPEKVIGMLQALVDFITGLGTPAS